MGAVLQPAVAVRGERYGGGGGDVEAVGEVPHQPVEVGGGFLGDRDRGTHGGAGAGEEQREAGGGRQHEERDPTHRPAGGVPAHADEVAGGPARQQHHGDGRGQHRDGQRPAADPQHGQRPGTRGLRPRLHTDAGHVRTSPPPVLAVLAVLVLLTPPLWHPPLTSQCRWAKCLNACAAP
ncbi:hypothetical protein GCM10020295_43700 [Streptomyces cinereospinus]